MTGTELRALWDERDHRYARKVKGFVPPLTEDQVRSVRYVRSMEASEVKAGVGERDALIREALNWEQR